MAPPLLIAHRLPDTAAQCTALSAAGAGGFELDVQLRGGTVVVSHYLPFLQIPGWLEHDGPRFRWGGGRPRDPRLAEAIARVPKDATIVLDPKEMRAGRRRKLAAAVTAALRELPADRPRCVVTTEAPEQLRTYRAAGIRTWRTAGSSAALAALFDAGPLADAGVAVRHTLLTPKTVTRLHDLTQTVAAWTVNDAARAQQLAAMGVDAITTDATDVLSAFRGS